MKQIRFPSAEICVHLRTKLPAADPSTDFPCWSDQQCHPADFPARPMRGIAAQIGSAEPRFVEVAEPRAPRDHEVLCQTIELGICGTDREILESRRPVTPDADEHLVLGHECLGRVQEVGAAVTELAAGDLVVPLVRRAAVESPVRVDLLAFGEYTERGIVAEHGFSAPLWTDRAEYLFRVEPPLAPFAVLTEPLSVAEKGINEARALQRARLGEEAWRDPPPRVLVTGMGPIGFAAVVAAHCRGWPVTMFGRDSPETSRAELAADLGAKYLPATAAEFPPSNVEAGGFDLVLECTGSDAVMIRAAGALASRGVMVWLGSSRDPRPVSHNVAQLMRDAVLKNHIHVGSVNAAPRDFSDALAHLDHLRKVDATLLARLITERLAPGDALWHYAHRNPQGIKVVVEYDGLAPNSWSAVQS